MCLCGYLLIFVGRYNALERREVCKGGKETSKKAATTQSSTKGPTAAAKVQSSQNSRRNEVSSAYPSNQSVKTSRPTSGGGPTYDKQVLISVGNVILIQLVEGLILISMQITELKLSVDSLEKERDYYFAKLRDIEILCQSPEIEHSPVCAKYFPFCRIRNGQCWEIN